MNKQNKINSFCEKNNYLKWVFLFLFILTIGIHFYLSLENAEKSSELSSSVTEDVITTIEDITNKEINHESAHTIIRKLVGHFMWFSIIGLFGYFTFRFFFVKKYYIGLGLCCTSGIIIALASELLQMIPSGRSCEIKDMLIDYLGYLVFVFVLFIVHLFIYKNSDFNTRFLKK